VFCREAVHNLLHHLQIRQPRQPDLEGVESRKVPRRPCHVPQSSGRHEGGVKPSEEEEALRDIAHRVPDHSLLKGVPEHARMVGVYGQGVPHLPLGRELRHKHVRAVAKVGEEVTSDPGGATCHTKYFTNAYFGYTYLWAGLELHKLVPVFPRLIVSFRQIRVS
jgi:hypothetical protein